MSDTYKKVLILVAGGSFFGFKPNDGRTIQLPSDESLREILEGEVAAHAMGSNIQLGVEILDRDETGANQRPEDTNKIGAEIYERYEDYDGFFVMHGGDTIPWAASQLAFSFDNLSKPIIFSECRVNSAASSHVASMQTAITAIQLAAYSNIPESCVLSSNGTLVKGVDAIQTDAGVSSGFSSRNGKILAHIGKEITLEKHNIKEVPSAPLSYMPADTDFYINVYNANPIAPAPLLAYMSDDMGGLVMSAPGFGNVNLNVGGIREELQKAQEQKIPVMVLTDCTDGFVNFNYTDHGAEMKKLGLINGGAMTTSAAVNKLRSLLSKQTPYEEMAAAMEKDMYGETMSHPDILAVPDFGIVTQPTVQP